MKRVLLAVAAVVFGVLAVCVFRAATLKSRQRAVPAADASGLPPKEEMAQRLAAALAIATVSRPEPPYCDDAPLAALRAHLERQFPLVHQRLERELVNGNALLFTWKGSDPSLPAFLSIAHQDVVPVDEATLKDWTHPPFGGVVADGFIWGRGAIDDKSALVGQLEAVEALLRAGFTPKRSVYFAFGQDEEVGGVAGAKKLAEALQQKGARIEFMIDEGLPITTGVIAGVDSPVAAVGVAEKGIASIELVVNGAGGHASAPPPNTAAGILAAAIARIEANPFPTVGGPHIDAIGEWVAPEMPFGARLAFANLWLMRPLVYRQLQAKPGTAALTRTTVAATMLQGSSRSNVLPIVARGVVNVRMLPGETIDSVLARLNEVIADSRVRLSPEGEMQKQGAPVSSSESRGFKIVERAVRSVHGNALVVPTLVVGTTDSPHYLALTADSYRHYPYVLTNEDIPRIHGTNERLSVEAYARGVLYFRELIREAASE